MYTNP
ncbi:uncharacterized protein FFC1_05947 [Fusarium fujikuroi]